MRSSSWPGGDGCASNRLMTFKTQDFAKCYKEEERTHHGLTVLMLKPKKNKRAGQEIINNKYSKSKKKKPVMGLFIAQKKKSKCWFASLQSRKICQQKSCKGLCIARVIAFIVCLSFMIFYHLFDIRSVL